MFRRTAILLLTVVCTYCARAEDDPDGNVSTIEPKAKHQLKLTSGGWSVSFSADGKRVACKDGNCAKVWDTRSGELLAQAKVEIRVNYVCLSPDGRILAFTSDPGTDIDLLDVARGKVVRTLKGHTAEVVCPVFSPDGKTIASFAVEDGLKLWDSQSGKELERFKETERFSEGLNACGALAFSPDGLTLAVGTHDAAVSLIEVATGKVVRKLKPSETQIAPPTGLSFSPDGRHLAFGSWHENRVRVWDAHKGELGWEAKWGESQPRGKDRLGGSPERGPESGASDVAFSADGKCLLVGCYDKWVRAWEVATHSLRYKVPAKASVAAARAGAFWTTSEREKGLSIFELKSCLPPSDPADSKDADTLWSGLDGQNASVAFAKMRDLVGAPREALAMLDKRLTTAPEVKRQEMEELIKDLDDESFTVRENAKRRLGDLREIAKDHLVRALTRDPPFNTRKQIKELIERLEDAPTGERLQLMRALEVLEAIDTAESRCILERLAAGNASAFVTREAQAALSRHKKE